MGAKSVHSAQLCIECPQRKTRPDPRRVAKRLTVRISSWTAAALHKAAERTGIDARDLAQAAVRRIAEEYRETGKITINAGLGPAVSLAETIAGIPATEKPPVGPAEIPAQPSEAAHPPADYRKAWRVGLGWMEGHNPPPTLDDLLPLEMREKPLQVWLATGTNVLYSQALMIISTIVDGGSEAVALIRQSMEADLMDRMGDLVAKWEGGSAE